MSVVISQSGEAKLTLKPCLIRQIHNFQRLMSHAFLLMVFVFFSGVNGTKVAYLSHHTQKHWFYGHWTLEYDEKNIFIFGTTYTTMITMTVWFRQATWFQNKSIYFFLDSTAQLTLTLAAANSMKWLCLLFDFFQCSAYQYPLVALWT